MLEITNIDEDNWLVDESGNKMACLSRADSILRVGNLLQVTTSNGTQTDFDLSEEYKGKSAREIIAELNSQAYERAFEALNSIGKQ